jgi:hypothetical protein
MVIIVYDTVTELNKILPDNMLCQFGTETQGFGPELTWLVAWEDFIVIIVVWMGNESSSFGLNLFWLYP